jgi:hypothetical protein
VSKSGEILTIYPLNLNGIPKDLDYYCNGNRKGKAYHSVFETIFTLIVNSIERSVLMHTSNAIKVDVGNIDRNTSPSPEMLELVSQLGQALKQEPSMEQNLARLVYEVANQVAIAHGRYLQRFFVKPE